MENGGGVKEYVVSGSRRGLKREFAFVLSQAEFVGSPGRTRAQRSQNGLLSNQISRDLRKKRVKKSDVDNATHGDGGKSSVDDRPMTEIEESTRANAVEGQTPRGLNEEDGKKVVSSSEEEPKSDVVDLTSDDEQKSILVDSASREEAKEGMTESTSIESPEVVNEVKECNSDRSPVIEIPKRVEAGPHCEGGSITEALMFTSEASYGTPQKRVTRSATKTKEEAVELSSNADERNKSAENDVTSKLEMKTSKRAEVKRSPTKLKELLQTGLLEGLTVRYLRGPKTRGPSDAGQQGIIRGSGILCSCDLCGGKQVVTPNKFELHAGSANKRPAEYIYLQNGTTLRDVLNACKDTTVEGLEVTIKNVISCSSENKPIFCLNSRGSIPQVGVGKQLPLCNSCTILKDSEPSTSPSTDTTHGPRLGMSSSMQASSGSVSVNRSSQSKAQGKLTRKDLRMHKLVFEDDVLPDGTALAYYARGKKCVEGYKKGFGIFCLCCNNEVSPSQFEAHAGWASRRKPYLHIYTSNGVSLHELSIALTKTRKVSEEEKDDMCSICGDGGELLCCDSCPRVFHTVCVSLPDIPAGDWYCKYCQNTFQKEKFVERNANALAAGRVAGIDPLEQITKRCIRIVEVAETDGGGCALCGSHDFNKSGFDARTVIICDQCEKEYHVGCLKEHEMDDLQALPEGVWFCCTDCNRIHSALQKQLVGGEEKLPESLLNVLKKKFEEKGSETGVELDIKWRLLSGKMASDETRAVLSRAVSIFHDRFDPIADSNSSRSSRLDLIPHMVYGRNWKGQELGGMYCAVLSVNSSIVSAGVFRIFGREVAELPLVATSTDCQGLGYFQSLFSCIEKLLRSLNVQKLVLPAAEEAKSIWTNKFGFGKMADDELKQYRKHYQMMVFQGTSMLHKSMVKPAY